MLVTTAGTPLPLAEQMFADATWWHLAARILYAYAQTDKPILHLPGVPTIGHHDAVPLMSVASPVEAFALELYFKAGLIAESKEVKRTHSLRSQYRYLETSLRRDIRNRYDEWCKVNTGWDTWWASNGQSTAFDDIMKASSDAFVGFRYMAQNSRHPTKPIKEFKFFLMPVTEATRDALVKRYPLWAKHAALHGDLVTFRTR